MVASRKPAKTPVFKSLDEEIEWYETHDSWDEDDVEVEIEVKQPLDKVIPVRLTDEKWSALRREATDLGIGPTTLARMWILEKLRTITSERAESQPPPRPRAAGKSAGRGRSAPKRAPARKRKSA